MNPYARTAGFGRRVKEQFWEPARAIRMGYLPFLMVYLAYGLGSLTVIATIFWTKGILGDLYNDIWLRAPLVAIWMFKEQLRYRIEIPLRTQA